VAEYEASGGVEGATLEGRAVVILTSVGAKSGKVRKNPVMQIVDGPRAIEEFIAPTITQARPMPANRRRGSSRRFQLPSLRIRRGPC